MIGWFLPNFDFPKIETCITGKKALQNHLVQPAKLWIHLKLVQITKGEHGKFFKYWSRIASGIEGPISTKYPISLIVYISFIMAICLPSTAMMQ